MDPNKVNRIRAKLADKVLNQYNGDHDMGPDAPVPYMTYQVADVLDDLLDLLFNEPENLENKPQILSANPVDSEIAKGVAEFADGMDPQIKQAMLEYLFMTVMGVPLVVAAERLEKDFNLHGLVSFTSPDQEDADRILRDAIQAYLHGEQ